MTQTEDLNSSKELMSIARAMKKALAYKARRGASFRVPTRLVQDNDFIKEYADFGRLARTVMDAAKQKTEFGRALALTMPNLQLLAVNALGDGYRQTPELVTFITKPRVLKAYASWQRYALAKYRCVLRLARWFGVKLTKQEKEIIK